MGRYSSLVPKEEQPAARSSRVFLLDGFSGRRRQIEIPASRGEKRAEVEALWGEQIPTEPGRDAREILEAAARRELDVLYLIGVDPLTDFPDAADAPWSRLMPVCQASA